MNDGYVNIEQLIDIKNNLNRYLKQITDSIKELERLSSDVSSILGKYGQDVSVIKKSWDDLSKEYTKNKNDLENESNRIIPEIDLYISKSDNNNQKYINQLNSSIDRIIDVTSHISK